MPERKAHVRARDREQKSRVILRDEADLDEIGGKRFPTGKYGNSKYFPFQGGFACNRRFSVTGVTSLPPATMARQCHCITPIRMALMCH